MIKVRINKASNKCGGSTELVVMTEGGNVFAGQTADIPIDYIEPTLNGISLLMSGKLKWKSSPKEQEHLHFLNWGGKLFFNFLQNI